MTCTPGSASRSSNSTSASSIDGSRLTTTTPGWRPATVPGSSSAGSPSATTSAPASVSAVRSWSRTSPARARSATRTPGSGMGRLQPQHLEHVPHELDLLVGLAEIAVDADVERALAVLLAGARRDHDDRHVLHARVGLHVLREF